MRVLRYLIASVLSLGWAAHLAAAEFEVEWVQVGPGVDAVSRDAEYFMTSGSARVVIHRVGRREPLADLCCFTRELPFGQLHFVSAGAGDFNVLWTKRKRGADGGIVTDVGLYSLEGDKVSERSIPGSLQTPILVSPNGRFFGLIENGDMNVYASESFALHASLASPGFTHDQPVALSSDGRHVAYLDAGSVNITGLADGTRIERALCEPEREILALQFLQDSSDRILTQDEFGRLCVEQRALDPAANELTRGDDLLGAFEDPALRILVVVLGGGIVIYDEESLQPLGTFLIQDYFERSQGLHGRTFFVSPVQYSPEHQMVSAKVGGVQIGLVRVRIQLERSATHLMD